MAGSLLAPDRAAGAGFRAASRPNGSTLARHMDTVGPGPSAIDLDLDIAMGVAFHQMKAINAPGLFFKAE
jgi:hypothetical protein